MFGFEPMMAMENVLAITRVLLIVGGIIAIIRFLFNGNIGLALLTLVATAFISFSFQPGAINNLGESVANILTIENISPSPTESLQQASPQLQETPQEPQSILAPNQGGQGGSSR